LLQQTGSAFTEHGWKWDIGFQIAVISLFLLVTLLGANQEKTLRIYIYLYIIAGVGLAFLLYHLKRLAVTYTRGQPSHAAGFKALFSPIDAQFASYLSSRVTGVMIIVAIYTYVITSFAAIYYYIDHCNTENDLCAYVDFSPVNRKWIQERDYDWKNFSINPEATVNGGTYSKISVFLPYLYFSVVTTTTVGYGDVYPISVTAVWLVILHHLVSIVLLIGIAGQVAGFTMRQSP
jgi:hypothetical protein